MTPATPVQSQPPAEWIDAAIREDLAAMVASREFPASRRLRALLTHLVESAIGGNERALNQRELAVAIFGRGDKFDPELDAIVRVEMIKLRKAISAYYASTNHQYSYQITIPKGQYLPRFELLAGSPGVSPQATTEATLSSRQTLLVTSFECRETSAVTNNLAQSLTDELEITLAKLPYLRVIQHHRADDASQQSQGFMLRGSVQRDPSRLRVNASLQSLTNGEILWAERFDRTWREDAMLAVQDEIVTTILARTADVYSGSINQSLMEAIHPEDKSRFTSEEATLLFIRYLNRHSMESYQAARRALEYAAPRDPENAVLLALLVDARRAGYALGFTEEDLLPEETIDLARRALAQAPENATCLLALGYALLRARQKTELMQVLEPLLDDQHLSPGYRGDAALAVAMAGEWQRGCDVIAAVQALMPTAPHSFSYPTCVNAYRQGDYHRALKIAEQFRPSTLFWQPMLRAAILGKLGNVTTAEKQLALLLDSRPEFPRLGRRWISCFILEDSLVDDLLDGLATAGLTPGSQQH